MISIAAYIYNIIAVRCCAGNDKLDGSILMWDVNCSSLLAEEFRLLPEIRLLQGDEQQTIHKQ
ncbi:hypothetical protein OUZ56_011853 [Daphnia magna]|uniref:Uncharacterized protein n=1 Tax=Daphnia magna TaxID=35525 RepID=A0ABQ9Z1G6_9CRUS|nr:hypothetical protein OUZ56_011853 [Daphnia magna]